MPEAPEVSLDQIRDILDLLKRTIEGAAALSQRVETLEKASRETYAVLVTLQQTQKQLLEGFRSQSDAQNKLNADITAMIGQLIERLDLIEGKRRVM